MSYPNWAEPGQTVRTPLAPISDTEALLLTSVRGMGETLRIVTLGEGEAAVFAGYVFARRPR